MPTIGHGCHELIIIDNSVTWRIIYQIDSDAIVVLDVFKKKTRETPKHVISDCKTRLAKYIESIG